jgi:hypothetical protein
VSSPGTRTRHAFSETAKLTVGLAATALPFARSSDEEAELWLRILRMHGAVGSAMQSLGVPERPLCIRAEAVAHRPCRPDALDDVIAAATIEARERGADAIATQDLLVGVIATYGPSFQETLAVRGTTPAEVLERISAVHPPAAEAEVA